MKPLPFTKNRQTRLTVLSVLLALITVLYSVRAFSLQITGADSTAIRASGISRRTAVLKAPRGEILDCFGREIAVNRDGYNIVFNAAYIDKKTLNDTILTLTEYLSGVGVEWADELPLEKTGNYGFTNDDNTEFTKRIGLAHYATAENCFSHLIKKYGLENYSSADKRTVMGVRYTMDAKDFSVSNPYTFAEDVPDFVMQKVSESGFMLSGITVDVVPFREYPDTSFAPNIVGNVGLIDAENWQEYKEKGYSFSDKVGKSGIELYAEDWLRGTDGQITYTIDKEGNIISSEIAVLPVPGKTVMLTLDKSLQSSVQAQLSSSIRSLQANGGPVTGGAAVIMDISSGSVLCAANYPSFDYKTLSENIEALLADKTSPLLNRSFSGIYPIGSTAKPAVAVAALMNGKLAPGEHIRCLHTYTHFKDYQPSCMGRHGSIGLTEALSKSCNYFFFELGYRLGGTTVTDTFRSFGLGVDTGIELSSSKGILADVHDGDGDTLQISIGQKNAFTPLQLAVYTSTLANGGTRYKATLIESVCSYDLKETYISKNTEVLGKVDITDDVISAVKTGMLSVTEDGTGSRVFANYPIKVGGKTGTAQTNSGADHSVFIAFAPYDAPKIAIAVILEHGSSGVATGNIVKSALDSYFFNSENTVDKTVDFSALP